MFYPNDDTRTLPPDREALGVIGITLQRDEDLAPVGLCTHNPGSRAEKRTANALGIRRMVFAVEDIDDTVARLRAHGAKLVGEVARYENSYRLCYLRGPEGILVALAQPLR